MDTEYIEVFVEESKSLLTDLNNLLLELEKRPDDMEIITSIFRIAHTLKGNSAAMGYEGLSELAHAIEDLLDALRQGKTLDNKIMNLIFEGVDMITLMLEEIIANKSISNPEELISKIREELERRKEEIKVRIRIKPSQMKGIDAILVMKKIEDIAEIIDSSPSFNEIEDGKFEMFELRLKGSVDEVNNILSKLPQVQEFDFEAKKHSKEQKKEQIEKESGERGDESRKAEVFTEKIQSIRISVHKLDELMNLVEELVIRRLKLENSLPEEVKREIGGEFSAFDRIIARLQDTVMDLRLIPLKHIVDRLPRMVRDLCKSLGKEVDFKIEGSDVTVDRNAIDKIQDPLIHMVRNAIDHGIEPPDVRERTGKNRTGKVILRASKLKDHVLIEVSDDGKGLDPKEIKDKAVEMGVIPREKAEELSEEELYNIILLPGFSTAKKVTDISGRGVGTDIIVNTVKSLGGSVEVKSEKGKGTTFKLRLPLTMAISQVLLVKVGGEKYGIPIRDIIEVKPINACEIRNVGGMDRLIARDKIVPLIHLNKALGIDSNSNGEKMVVVVSSLEKILALACDSVLAQKEVVVKSLGMLRSVKGISGISILGEGEVVPILDVNTLQEVSV